MEQVVQEEQKQGQYDETQQKVIKYIIKNTQYGETEDALKELGKLVNNFNANDTFIKDVIREHNQEHLAIVKGDNNYQYVLTPVTYDQGYYLDQKNSIRLLVDPISLKMLSKEQIQLPKNEFFDNYRKAIEDELNIYMKSYYKDTDSGYNIYIDWDNDDFTIYIGITCKELSLKNFKGGEWISEWKLDGQKLEGKCRINAHFFEDGNVALRDIKSCSISGLFKGADAVKEGQDVVRFIKEQECLIQNSLKDMYADMGNLFFKGMRRLLPISGQKMDWGFNVHRVRSEILK